MSLLLLYTAPKKRTGGFLIGTQPIRDDDLLLIWEANRASGIVFVSDDLEETEED